ncbi:MAG: hypothetical protein R6W90_06430 [Ignavibacteriaceae bacterium]
MEDNNSVTFEGIHCTLTIERPSENIINVRISGHDAGEFGDVPLQELSKYLEKDKVIELFIDARNVRGASIEVSGLWAHWLSANKMHFSRINMLTGSRFIQLTADFVRKYANLGDTMRLYSEPAAFDSSLSESLNS